ncbi:hypothetical protein J4E83_010250 [Alternaria metachromatica]|uniref:uncharacterized protein n=1 Tax=Alternaria metachromatica TaxID=283354 RepID=UPI0020C587F6|nr:uncharacterized protein J4E83_010250 [Alternaria metachromatica]KAI4605984.1 hypothetical protein J4E83_010250 [Alternaria metachromatica]
MQLAINTVNPLKLVAKMHEHESCEVAAAEEKTAHTFPGAVHIQDAAVAKDFALNTYIQPSYPRTLVVWADGNGGERLDDGPCTAAIGYHDPLSGEWEVHITVSHHPSWTEASLIAIQEAFRAAAAMADHIDHLIVFSNAKEVLANLGKSSDISWGRGEALVERVQQAAKKLMGKDVQVDLRFVPNRTKIEGHRRVQKLSRKYKKKVLTVAPKALLEYDIDLPPIRLKHQQHKDAKEELEVLLRSCLEDAKAAGKVGPRSSLKHEWRFEARRLRKEAKREYRKMREREGKPLKPTDSEIAILRAQKGRPRKASGELKEEEDITIDAEEKILEWKDIYQELAGSSWEDRRPLKK